SSRRRHTRSKRDWSSDVCSSDLTLTNTESGIINYNQIIDYIIDTIEENKLNVKGIMYDPWNASSFVTSMEDKPYPLIEVQQNYRNLSEPLKQFRLDVFEKKILHNGNPNLKMAINNSLVKWDNNGNIVLDKQKNREKIDAIVAIITAFTQAMFHEFEDKMEEYILSDDFGF